MTETGMIQKAVEEAEFGYEKSETDYPLEEEPNRASLIGVFQKVFNDSPYGENFDYETMDGFLEDTRRKDYEGKLAISEGEIVGFAWGYRIEPGMEEKFPAELRESDQDFFDGETFYFEELGVLPDYRGRGIGKELKRRELEEVKEREDISRGLMRTQYNGEDLKNLEVPEELLDEDAEGNAEKLGLDVDLGFEPVESRVEPVIEEVNLVGTEGSDERIYMRREL